MPVVLSKLPCGIIYTDAFRGYVERVHAEQAADQPQRVLTFEYVRCATGPLRGRAWCQFLWLPQDAVPDYRCYRLGSIVLHIPKSTQHGLRERCLDYRDGRVVVQP